MPERMGLRTITKCVTLVPAKAVVTSFLLLRSKARRKIRALYLWGHPLGQVGTVGTCHHQTGPPDGPVSVAPAHTPEAASSAPEAKTAVGRGLKPPTPAPIERPARRTPMNPDA